MKQVKHFWTLDKPMASLSTCHMGVLPWMAILLNLVRMYVDTLKVTLGNTLLINMWMNSLCAVNAALFCLALSFDCREGCRMGQNSITFNCYNKNHY